MKDKLRRIVLILLGLSISIGCTILVMIHGWGLTPKSWVWIVGVYFFIQFVAGAIFALAKDK